MVGAHTAEKDWIGAEEARQYYRAQPGLTVASGALGADGTPPWQVRISPGGWFRVLFSGEAGTPLREVSWEPRGDLLLLRETKDLFYPDGDPGRRVPYEQVASVTREYFTDGRVRVVLKAPDLDLPRTLRDIDVEALLQPRPAFGQWAQLVEASSPPSMERYGADASDAALALALEDLGGEDVTGAPGLVSLDARGGWVMEATERQIYEIAVAVADGAPVPYAATVLRRGPAAIIPLGFQGRPAKGHDPAEDERSLGSLDDHLRGLLAHRTQDPVQFLASRREWYDSEATAVHYDLLKAAGVTSAWYSYLPPTERHAVMRVWAGDLARGTRTLALHVVPAHWCSDRLRGEPPVGVDLRWGRDDLVEEGR
jgi:hypothetical protein